MSWSELLHRLLSSYPSSWRARYGDEMDALIDDLLKDTRRARWRLGAGLAFGAVKEHVRPTVSGGDRFKPHHSLDPRVPRMMRHRDLLHPGRLGQVAESQLLAGEVVVGSFDAKTSWPSVWAISAALPAAFFGEFLAILLHDVPQLRNVFPAWSPWPLVVLGVAGYLLPRCWLLATRSRRLTFVLTNYGLVVFQNGLHGRAKTLVARMPAVSPEPVYIGSRYHHVRIGTELVWVHRADTAPLSWMAVSVGNWLRPAWTEPPSAS